MGTLVVSLIVLQLLSFYFIVILNMKLSKFKDLERKQEQLMREMDDIVGAYLLEMREENDRLIEELSKAPQPVFTAAYKDINTVKSADTVPALPKKESYNSATLNVKEATFELEARALVPKAIATKAYAQQKIPANETQLSTQPSEQEQQSKITEQSNQPLSYEEEVVKLANEGKSAEEIAKLMQKGKTEIELLLKFHS